MSTIEEARTRLKNKKGFVWVHKKIVHYVHQDAPDVLRIRVGFAATWCDAAIIHFPGQEIPRAQQIDLTEDEARELIELGADDRRDDEVSRAVGETVARVNNGRTTKPFSEVMEPIIEACFTPNAYALASIIGGGQVAVAVFKLDEGDALAQQAARDIGWDGSSAVFPLSRDHKQRIIDRSVELGDPLTAQWLRGERNGRIFLWTGRGTVLVNFEPGRGYSLEPGSNDAAGDR